MSQFCNETPEKVVLIINNSSVNLILINLCNESLRFWFCTESPASLKF
jgi:hypothetical protein